MVCVRRLFIRFALALGLLAAAAPHARADLQSNVDLGVQFFPAAASGTISQMGYFVNFQTESRNGNFRPLFGGSIEANFGTIRVLSGFIKIGAEMIAGSARRVKPYIGVIPQFGWCNTVESNVSYVGMLYGGTLTAGVEIRTGTSDNAGGFRLTTGFRMLFGTPGGSLTATQLTTYQLSLGFLF